MLTVDCILKQYPCFGGPRKLPHNLLLKRVKQKFAILEFSSVSLRVCIILSWIVLMARSKIVAIDIRILSLSALVALGTRPPTLTILIFWVWMERNYTSPKPSQSVMNVQKPWELYVINLPKKGITKLAQCERWISLLMILLNMYTKLD